MQVACFVIWGMDTCICQHLCWKAVSWFWVSNYNQQGDHRCSYVSCIVASVGWALANIESGLTPSAVCKLYNACVIPVCDFGAEVWWMGQSKYQQKFETVQIIALHCILGAFCTPLTIPLFNECALPPVAVQLNHMRRKYAIQILTFHEIHPIWQHCLSTFPPFYQISKSSNTNRHWIPRDSRPHNNWKFETRFIQTLSTFSLCISNSSEMESYSTTACQPWTETRVKTQIDPCSQEKEAKVLATPYEILKQDDCKLFVIAMDQCWRKQL
jgi:hypothetical protein